MFAGINWNAVYTAMRAKMTPEMKMKCCMKDNTDPNTFTFPQPGGSTSGPRDKVCGENWWGNSTNCDQYVRAFCASHKDDPRCACYADPPSNIDPDQARQIKAKPFCYSQACNTTGYVQDSYKTGDCPNITICKQDLATMGSSNLALNNVAVQDCSTGDRPTPITPGISGVTSPTAIAAIANQQKTIEAEKQQKMYMYIAIIAIVLFAVYYINDEEKKAESPQVIYVQTPSSNFMPN